MPQRLFVSHSAAIDDLPLRDRLLEHLAPLGSAGVLQMFHRGLILAGDDPEGTVHSWMGTADIVLILVSSSYFADKCAIRELDLALRREDAARCHVIPVLLRPCDWPSTPLKGFQHLPVNGKPITNWSSVDDALLDVVAGLKRILEEQPSPPSYSRADALEAARSSYLSEVSRYAGERRVLAPLSRSGFLLRDIWVSPRLARDPEGDEPLPPLVELVTRPDGRLKLAVLGDVGTGKSELLVNTAGKLAVHAAAEPGAPLPLLLNARDLEKGIEAAIRTRWPVVADQAILLFKASNVRLVLLVDALDEAGEGGRDHVSALEQQLADRVVKLVISARPVVRSLLADAEPMWLSTWNSAQMLSFLRQWRAQHPGAVQAIRASPHQDVLKGLFRNPLMAALCLLIAESRSDALRSRTRLFDAVIRHLFGAWASPRIKKLDVEHAWKHVAPVLRKLALDVVRRSARSVSPADLDRAFIGTPLQDEAYSAMESLELHLGVLVRGADGQYDFAPRGLAEFLAGQELLRLGNEHVLAAAREVWGQEAARHAIGWAGEEDAGRASTLLAALAEEGMHEEDVDPFKGLRPLLVAIRAAADLSHIEKEVGQKLVQAMFRALMNETSVWAGDRVADAFREFLRARPRDGEFFLEIIAQLPRSSRSDWYAAQCWDTSDPWVMTLYERDPAVRSVAAERLRQWVDDPVVRSHLLLMVYDEGHEPGLGVPAFGAGIALRAARRDEEFSGSRDLIEAALLGHSQFPKVAAAMALQPGEAAPELLADALRWGPGSGYSVPIEVFNDLASTVEGLRALNERFPGWREKAAAPARTRQAPQELTEIPPPSWQVRRRLIRAVAPALRFASEERRLALLEADPWVVVEEACAMAVEHPQIVLSILTAAPARRLPLFSEVNARDLGRAAMMHPRVRDELIRLWDRLNASDASPQARWAQDTYPGQALEALVRRNDPDAIRVYAEWLPHANEVKIGTYFDEPLVPFGPVPEQVMAVARPILERVWSEANDGYAHEGNWVHLSAWTAGSIFFCLTPVWRDDADFVKRLCSWLDSGQMERFQAALWALQRIPLAAETRARIRERIKELSAPDMSSPERAVDVTQVLRAVDRASLGGDLADVLRDLAKPGTGVSVLAAALLVPLVSSSEAHDLSSAVAAHPEPHIPLEVLTPRLAARLVEAAPESWAETLCEMANEAVPYATRVILLFLKPLRRDLQERVVRVWAHATDSLELPWKQEGRSGFECARQADRVREVLFDLGLEGVVMEEEDAGGPGDA